MKIESLVIKYKSFYPGLTERRLFEEWKNYQRNFKYSPLNFTNHQLFQKFEKKLMEGIPLEYINNMAYFYESYFYVDERVLIPRSETEILVEESLSILQKVKNPKICEVGVGSFCVGLSLALKLDKFSLKGIDICDNALDVAKINVQRLERQIKGQIYLEKNDRLNGVNESFDLIISNPPYIKESQRKFVHEQVQKFEPSVALYIKDSEYQSWFDEFFEQIHSNLSSSGTTVLEGHEDNLDELGQLSLKYFRDFKIRKDYNNLKRFLILRDPR